MHRHRLSQLALEASGDPLSRPSWAAAFGRRPEESRGEDPEASRASFETV